MEQEFSQNLLTKISEQAEIETDANSMEKIGTEEDLLNALEQIITHLIDTNFEKLLWILYRIDVDELKLKKALRENAPAQAPYLIARMIIDREKSKADYKEQSKSKPTLNDDLLLL